MRAKAAMLLALLVAATAFASSNDTAWRADVTFLTSELPKRHKNAFFHTTRAAFEAASADLISAIPSLSDGDVSVRVMQLVASIGDAHTSVGGVAFRRYPIGVYWFPDGLYVVKATAENADLIGRRLTAVGGHPIDEVVAGVATVISHENDAWLRAQAPSYVVRAEVLHALGFAEAGEARFAFDGSERTLTPANDDAQWVEQPENKPLYRRSPDLYYWYEYLESSRTLYIKYNLCRDMPSQSFNAFGQELYAKFQSLPIDRLVLDIRDNPGGNSSVLQPLISGVQSVPELNRHDRFFVIVGRVTFSSALLNAIQLRAQTNATFVGEPTGGKPNSYGEVLSFALPNSRLTVFYSTKYFQTVEDDPPSFVPEVGISSGATAFLAGRDPVLDWIVTPPPRRRAAGR